MPRFCEIYVKKNKRLNN